MEERIYFARHYQLPNFGPEKQAMLRKANVLVIGAGGLACPLLQYLCAAGVGKITVIDADEISASNLHRQVLYRVSDIGRKKVDVLKQVLVFPYCELQTIDAWLDLAMARDLFPKFDLIVDTSDNFTTRYVVNDVCEELDKCLVSAGITQYAGQLSVYNYPLADGTRSGSYRCLFPEVDMAAPNCSNDGVLSTAVGLLGLLQANEVIKVITKTEGVLANRLLLYDVRNNEQRIIKYRRLATDKPSIDLSVTSEENLLGISWEDLGQWKRTGKTFKLIDVREEWEHEESNSGGDNIPLGELINASKHFAAEEVLVFYCKRSERSRIAIQRLLAKGLRNAMFYVMQ